jgi:hypothetical protein
MEVTIYFPFRDLEVKDSADPIRLNDLLKGIVNDLVNGEEIWIFLEAEVN